MKRVWLTLLAAALTVAGGSAFAAAPWRKPAMTAATASVHGFRNVDWHRHHRGDDDDGGDSNLYFGFGNVWGPDWGPYWSSPGYYYYNTAPLVVTQAPPSRTVYISRDGQNRTYYWYYCKAAHGYYPYVKQCPGGWIKVVPHPPKN